jgi:ABC-type bacteriocin/lantibiotic exporter with double-glycine peptidase domain
VQNAGFRYPNAANFTLQGVMMEAKPGEIIAITGANGSGKTTLLKLLLGFYAPQVGSITFDGVDSQHFVPLALRQSIAYAPQKIQFFNGTIAQNFRLNEPDATDKEIMEAVEKAGLADQIRALPAGLQAYMGSQGMHPFSFGFLQKLNLARAYVRKSKIIMIDEPGRALDQKGDEILHQAISGFRRHKTTLLVTRRPSLIALADRVLYLQNGTMQAFGDKESIGKFSQGKQT